MRPPRHGGGRIHRNFVQFLCHAADRGMLLLHGSGAPAIRRFEPRQPDDSSEFGNRRAVFAADDGLWPMSNWHEQA